MYMKANILFLHPGPIYRPDTPDFKDKYLGLSTGFKGTIMSWTDNSDFKDYELGSFRFHALVCGKNIIITKLKLIGFVVKKALEIHYGNEKVDIIIAYDPMFTGLMGAIVKILTGCKLIIEINNSNIFLGVSLKEKNKFKAFIKNSIYRLSMLFTLHYADAIKLLTVNQVLPLNKRVAVHKIFRFHDYVPTHYFTQIPTTMEKYVLFVGYPFYRKGVDILIKAFNIISKKHSDFILKLVGHELCFKESIEMANNNPNIQFEPPVFYEEIKKIIAKCYCFILPSREEGLAKVLLEAMAAGKAVIGSNISGTPEAIKDGYNGFLFKSEDAHELASKLDILLSDLELTKKMGENGRRLIEEKFSSEKYNQYFQKMIDRVTESRL